jgi:arylsulfatase A-like enzyme
VAPTKPLFLLLHTYDIHGPYAYLPGAGEIRVGPRAGVEPRPAPARCPVSGACDEAAEWQRIRSVPYHAYQRFERFGGLAEARDAYDVGIRFVDTQLGVLLARLRDVGILDRSMLVITSDHGESLFDRSLYLGHSYTLYDEEVHVPLVVRLPDGRRGRSDALVDLADVAAWMLDAAGVPPPEGVEGRSPLARESGAAPARESVHGESSHTGRRYVRSLGWKFISAAAPGVKSLLPAALRDRFSAGEELYDYADDPRERRNRAAMAPLPDEAVALRAAGEAKPVPGLRNEEPAPVLDATQEQQLRELGYLR